MSKERRGLPKNLNTIAGVLSLIVITLYVADLGLTPARLFKPDANSTDKNPPAEQSADRIGTKLQVERFDLEGNLSHRFTSSRAEYYNQLKIAPAQTNDDSFEEGDFFFSGNHSEYHTIIRAMNPVVNVFDAGQAVAELTATMAITDAGNNRTELMGDVHLVDTRSAALLLTEKLVLNTQSKQILTRELVEIHGPNSTTTANGLQGNLTDQRWQLLSNVKSVIQP